MRTVKFCFVFFFIGYNNLFAQWTQQTSGTSTILRFVKFIDSNTGFTVGDNGTILKTTNGGATWVSQVSGTTTILLSISFLDNNTGYISGGNSGGIVLKTTNGGSTWTTVTKPPGVIYDWLRTIKFIDNNIGFTASGSYIYKTTNGGTSWIALTSQGIGATSLAFPDNNTIIAVQNKSIYKSTNGGTTWATQYPNVANVFMNTVFFVNSNTGYAAGSQGKIIKTTDGGSTWINLNSPTAYSLYSIAFIDNNIGYVVGSNNGTTCIFKTIDGGTTWTSPSSLNSMELNSITFSDNNTCFTVGQQGIILKSTNAGSWVENNSESKSHFSLYPNPANNNVSIRFEDFQSMVGYSLKITNILGQTMYNSPINKQSDNINLENWNANGIYFAQLLDSQSNIIEVRRFVIQ